MSGTDYIRSFKTRLLITLAMAFVIIGAVLFFNQIARNRALNQQANAIFESQQAKISVSGMPVYLVKGERVGFEVLESTSTIESSTQKQKVVFTTATEPEKVLAKYKAFLEDQKMTYTMGTSTIIGANIYGEGLMVKVEAIPQGTKVEVTRFLQK